MHVLRINYQLYHALCILTIIQSVTDYILFRPTTIESLLCPAGTLNVVPCVSVWLCDRSVLFLMSNVTVTFPSVVDRTGLKMAVNNRKKIMLNSKIDSVRH